MDSQPAGLRENEQIDNMSEDATNQSNCSSDGESIESNVDEDVSTKVNVSVPCPSDCAYMCEGCADLSSSHHLIAKEFISVNKRRINYFGKP